MTTKSKSPKVATIIDAAGNITIYFNTESYLVHPAHINYNKVITALSKKQYHRIPALVNVRGTLEKAMKGLVIRGNNFYYNGVQIYHNMTEKIVDLVKRDLPAQPMINMLDRLLKNRNKHVVESLDKFAELHGLPITEDGCILAWKRIRGNWRDIHTDTINNRVGKKPRITWDEIDCDPSNTCSRGLHFCSKSYLPRYIANDHTDRVILVKVAPEDIGAIPTDYNCAKARCIGYEVVAEDTIACKALIENVQLYSEDGKPVDHLLAQKPDGSNYWNKRDKSGRFTRS